MPTCDYCESHIDESGGDDDQPYLTHLAEEHLDEVSRVDERKLEKKWDGDLDEMRGDNYRFRPITIGAAAAAVVFIAGLGAMAVMGGSSSPSDSSGGGTEWIYEHGGMTVEINGEEVPASELEGSEYFYVQNETGEWRMNVPADRRFTVGDALAGLGLITDPESPAELSPEYAQNVSNAEMTVTVDGESVALNETIQHGQNITFTVEGAAPKDES